MKALGWNYSWHLQAFIGKADISSFLFNGVSPIKYAAIPVINSEPMIAIAASI